MAGNQTQKSAFKKSRGKSKKKKDSNTSKHRRMKSQDSNTVNGIKRQGGLIAGVHDPVEEEDEFDDNLPTPNQTVARGQKGFRSNEMMHG